MAEFLIKKGDTLPHLRMALAVDGVPLDLTDCTVNFKMRPADGGTLLVSEDATIIGLPTDGVVEYAWIDGIDTVTPGRYDAEWTVFTPDGTVTVPSSGFVRVVVTERIA